MIKRISYISRFSKPMDQSQLQQLGDAAAEKNGHLDITGILMASGGLFYQVLEGPEEAVDQIYASISGDSRHTDLLLLQTERDQAGRLFPDWSMKTVNLDAASHKRLLPLKALIKAVYEQQRLVDNMVWAIQRSVRYEMEDAEARSFAQ